MRNIFYFSILVLILPLPENSFGNQNSFDQDSITISSKWEIGHESIYKASLQRNMINDTVEWHASCSAEQHIRISKKTNEGFELDWTASGFALNIFYQFPGTMFDWAEEWLKGKALLLRVKTDINGTPFDIINQDEVRVFFTGMIDSLLKELPVKDVTPLNKDGVANALINTRDRIITSPGFAKYFLNNIQLVFILYNKSFYTDQNKYSTIYQSVPTLTFKVPMKINTKFRKKEQNIIEVITSTYPHPFDQWKIKPRGYSNIDFEVEEYSRLVFDRESSWTTSAESRYLFKRGKYEIATNITFKRVPQQQFEP
jgi:hypothetical protein